ncbi:MAG: ABC transporter permease [Nitrospirota bacterium]|jgi:peptide/nickel transport system permease protein
MSMPFAARRLALTLPVLLGVVTAVFLILHLVPGDPIDVMLGEAAAPADRATLRATLHLDEPLAVQYGRYLAGICRGDLGQSIRDHRPVVRLISERLPATLELLAGGVLVALCIALPSGIAAALSAGRRLDAALRWIAVAGVAVPNFWLGPLLILIFAIGLGWLPVSGRGDPSHLVLPSITLGTAMAGVLMRMTRSGWLDALGEDHVRTARAKGVGETAVVLKHTGRNATLPLLTVVGLQTGALLGGAVITETIFAWPGIGRLTLTAIQSRDYPLVQGCILFIAAGYVFVNLVVDLLYGLLDPRIRVTA